MACACARVRAGRVWSQRRYKAATARVAGVAGIRNVVVLLRQQGAHGAPCSKLPLLSCRAAEKAATPAVRQAMSFWDGSGRCSWSIRSAGGVMMARFIWVVEVRLS